MEVLKQYVFDCVIELVHGQEGLSKEEIADKLLWVVDKMDKLEEEE